MNKIAEKWLSQILEYASNYYGIIDQDKLSKAIQPIVSHASTVSFESFREFMGYQTKYWEEDQSCFIAIHQAINATDDEEWDESDILFFIDIMDNAISPEEN